ncbi:hypothetical protein [Actinomadura opuntiae]|uniref:hypothetical protein n=1 Tax=Actinomadura sp. OS1-43 TaxID=604315 RepID=UPI00255AD2AC|nr:hypothetical protein [Actinomadura sp. OS1-43]MDL4819290.1 hypothetical protein [Actinomadura sp. OS1-43]
MEAVITTEVAREGGRDGDDQIGRVVARVPVLDFQCGELVDVAAAQETTGCELGRGFLCAVPPLVVQQGELVGGEESGGAADRVVDESPAVGELAML